MQGDRGDHAGGRPTPAKFSAATRLKSFRYAWSGLRQLVRIEHNARLHLAATLAVIAAGLLLRVSLSDCRWLALAIGWVWTVEALNTAVEQICDLVSPGPNQIVRTAKDVAAGAVLVSSVAAALIGLATFAPYVIAAFR